MGNKLYTNQYRELALRFKELGWSTEDVASAMGVSRASIYRWEKTFESIGTATNPHACNGGRRSAINRNIMDVIHSLYKQSPDMYLEELQFYLAVKHDVAISISSLQSTLEKEGLTRKLLHKIARERDNERRCTWRECIHNNFDDQASYFVTVDETHKNEHTIQRRYGRSKLGTRATIEAPFVRGRRYSIVAALTTEGLMAVDAVEGSFDGDLFVQFIAQSVLPNMNPYSPGTEHSVLVLDNCSIHHTEELEDLVRDAVPAVPHILPVKAYMRRHQAEIGLAEDPLLAILEACSCITPEKARGWFAHAGFVV
ncbi:unnamed protein product [Mycena citricolor]|uniref:HTH cro/C1-type domain-containing protein n=1 Tax=Mycena citricolor TaxID=2018698 RepID=A0AAD2HXJ9_9AGAR|nr:unnamed protein product [Mycena citricolor]